MAGMIGARVAVEVLNYDRDNPNGNPKSMLGLHGSNFIFGLHYMTALHGCFGIMATKYQDTVLLRAVLAANMAGQTWEEIELPFLDQQKSLSINRSAGREVKTDLLDFASGTAGVLAYYLAAKATSSIVKGAILACH